MVWEILLSWVILAGASVVVTALALGAAEVAVRLGRLRWPNLGEHWRRLRRPAGATVLAVSLYVGTVNVVSADAFGRAVIQHILLIGMIAALVWFLATLVLTGIRVGSRRLVASKISDQDRREVQTQMRLVDRLVAVFFVILGAAMILLTFPGVDRIGATILASAGLLSVVAGLAAQSSLANVFAGIQLAFADALRIGDIVVVENEYGRIEDITLTYVVVRIWDDRRLVMPSTYFTTTPFTNWTRTGTEVIGTVFLELDWRVDVAAMRERLSEIVSGSDLWDGRACSLLVTDATGSVLTLRAVMSAANADALWDLRCLVREELARWVRESNPEGLPLQRVRLEPQSELRKD